MSLGGHSSTHHDCQRVKTLETAKMFKPSAHTGTWRTRTHTPGNTLGMASWLPMDTSPTKNCHDRQAAAQPPHPLASERKRAPLVGSEPCRPLGSARPFEGSCPSLPGNLPTLSSSLPTNPFLLIKNKPLYLNPPLKN